MIQPIKNAVRFVEKHSARLRDPASPYETEDLERLLREAQMLLYGSEPEEQRVLWLEIGIIFDRLGDLPSALTACQQAQTIAPQDSVVANNLGRVLGRLGRTEEALAQFVNAAAYAAGEPDAERTALLNQTVALQHLDRASEAVDRFRRAERIQHPADAVDLRAFAVTSLGFGRDEDAVEYFVRSLCVRLGRPRGDRPALELLEAIAIESPELVTASESFVEAIARVRVRETDEPPPQMATPARVTLSPEAWTRFVALVEG